MIKRNKWSLIFITILVLVAIYFSIQFYYLKYVYNMDVHVDIAHLTTFGETITITKREAPDYLEYENIRVGNFFEDFNLVNPEYITHINQIYTHSQISANFWFGRSEEMPKSFIESFLLLADEFETNIDHQIILDRHNINNDAQLINLAANVRRNTIFTPIRRMKENYILNTFAEVVLSHIEEIAIVDGEYDGVMLTVPSGKELQILKNNRIYFFTFLNSNYFTDEKIQTIINTIIID